MNDLDIIFNELDKLYPNARCQLNYSNELELLIAVMLSAQTTDVSVNKLTLTLFNKYQTIEDYALAPINELEKDIRQIGLYRNKARNIKNTCIVLIEEYNSKVPRSIEELIKLPGVGRKTANVVISEAFNIPAIAVDTHVERVSKRLKLANKEDSVIEVENKLMKVIPKERWIKTHHQFIFFGRYFCKARSPRCNECNLKNICIKKADH